MAIGAATPTEPRRGRAQEADAPPGDPAWWSLLVALAIIAFFLLRSVFGRQRQRSRRRGSDRRARPPRRCENDHLTVGTTSTVVSNTVSSGVVMSTDPKAGASVAKNSAVDLVVSAGPAVSVPSVVGQQLTPADAAHQRRRPELHGQVRDEQQAHRDRPGAVPAARGEGQVLDEGALDRVGHPDVGHGAERARADRRRRPARPSAAPASTSAPRRTAARASTAAASCPRRTPRRTQRRNPTAPSTS